MSTANWRWSCYGMLVTLAATAGWAVEPAATTNVATEAAEMKKLSLEELMKLQVTAVTATRVATKAVDLPADVITIFRADFAAWNKNVIDALAPVPGVKLNSRQTDHLFLVGLELRGFSANDTSGNNVLILLDGIPQRRLSFGGPWTGGLPFDAVSRLELVKGPLGSLYGRGSLAGALQLFTDPGTREWHVATSGLFEDTADVLRGGIQVAGPISCTTDGTFSLTASAKQADGWQPRTDSEKRDIYLHVRLPLAKTDTLSVYAGFFDGFEDITAPVLIDKAGHRLPGIRRDTNLAVPDQNSVDLREYRAGANWQHRFDESFQTALTFGYWRGETFSHVGRPSDAPASGTLVSRQTDLRDWVEDSFLGQGEIQKRVDWNDWLSSTLTAGGSIEHLTWENTTQRIRTTTSTFTQGVPLDLATMIEPDRSTWVFENPTTRNADETDYGGFIRSQFEIGDRLTLHGGVRFDGYERFQKNHTTTNESTVTDQAFSPMAGIVVRAYRREQDAVNVYFTWGQGFSPVFRAVGNTEIASVNPETSESFEAGVKTVLWNERLEGTLAVYQIERQDVVGTPVPGVLQNTGDWRARGVETSLRLRPVTWVELYASYTCREPLINRDKVTPANEGNDIAFIPNHLAKAGIGWLPTKAVRLDVTGRYVGESFADPANTIRLPDYVLLEAAISYQWKNLNVAVFATNLLDEEYYADVFSSGTVVNGSAFEGTPRTFGVRVKASF